MRQSIIENLEARQLMSVSVGGNTLNIVGSDATADRYSVYQVGSKVQVNKLNEEFVPTGQKWTFDAAKVKTVYFNGKGKDDYIAVGLGVPSTLEGGAGNDQLYGGSGNDWINGSSGKDVLGGGAGNDTIMGGDQNDKLYGSAGNDQLYGGTGSDELKGGEGDDLLDGGWNSDKIYGDAGIDTVDYSKRTASVVVNLDDDKGGQAGETDYIHGPDIEIVQGGSGNDDIDAGGRIGTVAIYGNGGNDKLRVQMGTAKLYGGAGNDTLDAFDEKSFQTVDGGSGYDKAIGNTYDNYFSCEQITKFPTG